MFWSLFGLGDPKNLSLTPYENPLTEILGELLYGMYHWASIIVLLNMLVASMTQSYEKILVNLKYSINYLVGNIKNITIIKATI